jgi:hypothetical protein
MKGMAFQKPTGQQVAAFDHTVVLERLNPIMGTGWMETTMRPQPGTNPILIGLEHNHDQFTDHAALPSQIYRQGVASPV